MARGTRCRSRLAAAAVAVALAAIVALGSAAPARADGLGSPLRRALLQAAADQAETVRPPSLATNPRVAPPLADTPPPAADTTLFAEAPAGGAPTKAEDGTPGRPAHSSPGLAGLGAPLADAPAPVVETTPPVGVPSPSRPPPAVTVATRTTKAGVPCRLPLFYENALITDCTVLPGGGSVPSCFALGDIGPQPCVPAKAGSPSTPLRERLAAGGPGDGAMGSLCRRTNPAGASDCQAGFMCAPMPAGPLADSPTYGYCAGGGTAEGDDKAAEEKKKEGEDGGGLEAVPVASRTTVDGRACRLPLVVNGSLLTDCGAIGGKTACYVAPDDAADAAGALASTAECADKQGSWATAPLADVLAAGSAAGLDGRAGALCALALPGAPGRPASSLACAPGLTCTRVDAGPLKNAPYGTCLPSKAGPAAGPPKKPVPSIADRKPAPVSGAGLGIMPVASRVTADGAPCRLPVVMADGTMFTDCGPLGGVSGGVSACYTAGLKEWGVCAPRNSSTPPALPLAALLASGRGADGQRGSVCAADTSAAGVAAVPAPLCDSGLTCRPLSGPYGFCAGPKDAVATPAVPPAVDSGAADAAGAKQRVAAALAAADNSTAGLAARTVAQRTTVAGLPCRLPVRYKGKVLTDCAKIGDNHDHCFVGEGFSSHQKCRATAELPDAPSIAQMEMDGKLGDGSEGALCVLAEMAAGGAGGDAFAAGAGRGATCRAGLKCVPGSSAPLRGSRYGYCKAPAAAASAVDAVLHPKKHKEAKKAAADAALTPAQQAVADLAIADRVTAAGERCRLPAVVNGTLVTDCFAWPGYLPGDDEPTPPTAPAGAAPVAPAVPAERGAGACFTPASPTVPQRCARTGGPGGYSLSPLSALLALPGRAADAGPGALCTLAADTAARIAPGAAALPPCGAGTAGCAVLRPGGQLKASGLGFCLAIDGSDPAAGGAGGPAGAGLDKPVEVPGGTAYLPTGEETTPAVSKGVTGRLGPHCGPVCMWGSAFAMVLSAALISFVCWAAFCRGRRPAAGGPEGAIGGAHGRPGGGSFATHAGGVAAPATVAPAPGTGGATVARPGGRRYDRFEDAPSSTGTAAMAGATSNPFAGTGTAMPAAPNAFWADMAARNDNGGGRV